MNATNNRFTITNHQLNTNTYGHSSVTRRYAIVQNAAAFGLVPNQDYWIGIIDPNTFYLSLTRQGAESTAEDIKASGAVTIEAFAVHTSYYQTPEPTVASLWSTSRRYGMGTRRGVYEYNGCPGNYTYLDNWHRDDTHAEANNWYLKTSPNPPGGHLPGLLAGASQSPVSTTPPTISQDTKVNNGNGTFTLTGSAQHIDGIRCVRGYVHPNVSPRTAARMTWNKHGGTPSTNFDAATQDYTITVTGTSGQYLMLTAVSIHDQEHSIRVQL